MSEPRVTFIIAAFNAADTLPVALESLQKQSDPLWKAVIVDDGSTDATQEFARRFAASDPRFSVLHQENRGAAAARNRGVEAAGTPFIAFLDADDWIGPDFVEHMLPVASAGAGRVIAYCRSRRVTPEGQLLAEEHLPMLQGDGAMLETVSRCPIAIHTAILPRQAYLDVGGMPVSRRVCEDWELWTRLAHAGLQFEPVDRCMSFYRMQQGSLTHDPREFVSNAIEVIALAEGLLKGHFEGRELPEHLPAAICQLKTALWAAAFAVRGQADPAPLLALVPVMPDTLGHEQLLVDHILHGLSSALLAKDSAALVRDHQIWEGHVDKLLTVLDRECRMGARLLLWRLLVKTLVRERAIEADITIGPITVLTLSPEQLDQVPQPSRPDETVLRVVRGGRLLAVLDCTPATAAPLSSLLAAAGSGWSWRRALYAAGAAGLPAYLMRYAKAARRLGRPLVALAKPGNRRLRATGLAHRLQAAAIAPGNPAWPDALKPRPRVEAPVSPAAEVSAKHVTTDSEITDRRAYWDQIFDKPDPWNYLSGYETTKYLQTLDMLPEGNIGSALEIACAEGIFTRHLSQRVRRLLAVDISRKALDRAAERCADCPNVSFETLDLVDGTLPQNLDLVVCSEVLYYLEDWAKLETFARKVAQALSVGGCFVTAHARVLTDEPDRTGFDWGHLFGITGMAATFESVAGLVREETLETELYAIHRFRKVAPGTVAAPPVIRHADNTQPEAEVEKLLVRGGAISLRRDVQVHERCFSVPVLMYHRIAEEGPETLARWRTSPADFEQQMRLLRRLGYHAADSARLGQFLNESRPIAGRPVVITFDDGFQDFADTAASILERYDFNAEIFLVSERVGGVADWDIRHGTPAPLMTWDTIRDLKARGFNFGSHLATHAPATYLTGAALHQEALSAKATIENELQMEVSSIALPFGAYDDRTIPILANSGYRVGYSTAQGPAVPASLPLAIPRLEVRGGMSLAEFAAMLGHEGVDVVGKPPFQMQKAISSPAASPGHAGAEG